MRRSFTCRYRPRGAKKKIALVGKGICFDTGGHNLKPAKYMAGMHEDMNGSAVALGILLAASRAQLPVAIDCWLALAQNHISPRAYKQNDIVTALERHDDRDRAHRRRRPHGALRHAHARRAREARPDRRFRDAHRQHAHRARRSLQRYLRDERRRSRAQALAAAAASGERLCVFPMDDDYDDALESPVADVKQCTLEGGADHILAARLLKRFTDDRPWIHMDLSGSSCKGGSARWRPTSPASASRGVTRCSSRSRNEALNRRSAVRCQCDLEP